MNLWPALAVAAVLTGALVLATVAAVMPSYLAKRRAFLEPRRPAYRPAQAPADVRPPAEPCPGCPRCTGVGTFGMTAMDQAEPVEAVEVAPVMPLPRSRRRRKAA